MKLPNLKKTFPELIAIDIPAPDYTGKSTKIDYEKMGISKDYFQYKFEPMNLTIVSYNAYLDGGTQVFHFSDGFSIYKDHRLCSPTDGKYFEKYPSDDGIPISIDGKYIKIIESFDVSAYYKSKR